MGGLAKKVHFCEITKMKSKSETTQMNVNNLLLASLEP